MDALAIAPAAVPLLVTAVVAMVALVTTDSVRRTMRDRRRRETLRRLADEIESLRLAHDARQQLLAERLTRMEQALDGLSIEMERLGEGQRFVSRLLSSGSDRTASRDMRGDMR